jgi:HEAT repeat protein
MDHLWDGFPLKYWVAALNDADGEVRWRSIDALRHIADPAIAVPLLVGVLKDPYWRARALAVHALYDLAFDQEFVPLLSNAVMPLACALTDASPEIRLEAARTLELLGPTARAALPRLEEAVKAGDDELGSAASDAMLTIGGIAPVRRFPH